MNIRKLLSFVPDALAAMRRSKDRSTKVGAVAVDDNFVIRSSGYNGFPRGVNDELPARHERPLKYKWTVHAEANLVAQAARAQLEGATVILTSLHPCTSCTGLLIQAGVKRVLVPIKNAASAGCTHNRSNWDEEARISKEMFSEAGVEILTYDESETN